VTGIRTLVGMLLIVVLTCRSSGTAVGGTIWISGSPSASEDGCQFRPFNTFEFFVLADSIPTGIQAYDFGLNVPPQLALVSVEFPVNCDVCQADGTDFVVGLPFCGGGDPPFQLVHVTAMYVGSIGESEQICLRGSTSSSFQPPAPGFEDCAGSLQPFDVTYWCVTAACGLPVQRETLGMLKSHY
jgi:hypothetical protein